jgi:hypothetical protein
MATVPDGRSRQQNFAAGWNCVKDYKNLEMRLSSSEVKLKLSIFSHVTHVHQSQWPRKVVTSLLCVCV